MIRVVLPAPLRTLARLEGEVCVELAGPATQARVLDALEAAHPVLRGRIRDQTERRAARLRALLRLRAGSVARGEATSRCRRAVTSGAEPFIILGAMSGG